MEMKEGKEVGMMKSWKCAFWDYDFFADTYLQCIHSISLIVKDIHEMHLFCVYFWVSPNDTEGFFLGKEGKKLTFFQEGMVTTEQF